MKKALLAILALALIPLAYSAVTCSFESASTCGSGTKYLGVENDTGGINNSHAQNHSLGTYANSLCCTTNLSDTLNRDCGDETLAALSAQDNAHVQNDTIDTYSVDVCLGLDSSGVECSYVNGTCSAGSDCEFSMSGHDNAHVAECGVYDISVCCTTTNGPPTVPTLLEPLDGNASVDERHPLFNWTDSTDPQSDPIHYTINITAPAGCAAIPLKNTTPSEYTSVEELCTDETYNWTVRACDDENACSAWATPFNFTIESTIDIRFSTNNTDFGALSASTENNTVSEETLDDDPGPLVIENTGNVDVNTDVKALDALWSNAGLGTEHFQHADQDSSSWKNASSSYDNHTDGLAWSATRQLEIRVQVPIAEPPGSKSSTLQALAESAE